MGTIERWVHDSTLVELIEFYVVLKKRIIESEGVRWRIWNLNERGEILKNTTLGALRSIIESKLTNELYYEYIETYKEGETSATDFTTHSEFQLAKQRRDELDLQMFFMYNDYNFKLGLLDEEIEAEVEDTEVLDKYNEEVEYELRQEMLLGKLKK